MQKKFNSSPTHFIEVFINHKNDVSVNDEPKEISTLSVELRKTASYLNLHTLAVFKITPKPAQGSDTIDELFNTPTYLRTYEIMQARWIEIRRTQGDQAANDWLEQESKARPIIDPFGTVDHSKYRNAGLYGNGSSNSGYHPINISGAYKSIGLTPEQLKEREQLAKVEDYLHKRGLDY